jgi:DNA polymerase III delta prime subunit
MAKILISGIPGTGKTTVAEHLAEHFGYTHINVEAESFRARRELEEDAQAFLGGLATLENVVLSWGFGPYVDRPAVEEVIAAGFKFVWLDGNHVTSLRNFLAREQNDPHQEANYYGQMQMILATEVVEHLRPVKVDPFSGEAFRPVEEIAAEILRVVES